VTAVADRGNEAELTLAPSAQPSEVLRALVARADLTRFEVREPSLHEIFKRTVGSTGGGPGGDAGVGAGGDTVGDGA
jgi:ABC-type uncharacterized transport system ATPase subunit